MTDLLLECSMDIYLVGVCIRAASALRFRIDNYYCRAETFIDPVELWLNRFEEVP